MVFVPYCTGDEHKGQRTTAPKEAYPKGTWGFYFTGHTNLEHIIADLKTSTAPAIASASHILLTGGSAGGMGVLANADFFVRVKESFQRSHPLRLPSALQKMWRKFIFARLRGTGTG